MAFVTLWSSLNVLKCMRTVTALPIWLERCYIDCSWFSNKGKAARRKLEWEESLEHDNQKDQFVRSLSPEDREAYYASHH